MLHAKELWIFLEQTTVLANVGTFFFSRRFNLSYILSSCCEGKKIPLSQHRHTMSIGEPLCSLNELPNRVATDRKCSMVQLFRWTFEKLKRVPKTRIIHWSEHELSSLHTIDSGHITISVGIHSQLKKVTSGQTITFNWVENPSTQPC